MKLTYKPDGQAEQVWQFNLGKLRTHEAEAIEKRTGLPFGSEFKMQLLKGATGARRALLWTFLRREHHTIRFEDVDFADDELTLEMDRDEWQAAYDAVVKDRTIRDEAEREAQLAAIQQQIDE